jgi:hypothetical protein
VKIEIENSSSFKAIVPRHFEEVDRWRIVDPSKARADLRQQLGSMFAGWVSVFLEFSCCD